jgi:hypothetical protein
VTLRSVTSSADAGWAALAGSLLLTCGNATDPDRLNADLRAFGQHQGVRVVPR